MKNRTLIIILGLLAAACLITLVCVSLLGGITMLARNFADQGTIFDLSFTNEPTPTPVVVRPSTPIPTAVSNQDTVGKKNTPDPLHASETPLPTIQASPVLTETLRTLQDSPVPINDLVDVAWRLQGKTITSLTYNDPSAPYQAGAKKSFWVLDSESNLSFEVDATLQYVTDHAYFWIEDGVQFDSNELQDLGDTFEHQIYPTNRAFFGSEWSPGIDGDPHLYILYAGGLGDSIAGMFSAEDEYPPEVSEYSNAHEMFLLNADSVELDREFTYGVLAHEFQHMIHWYRDRNEELWLNEGFSELAMFLNNFDSGGVDYVYTADPDLQLNNWPPSDQDSLPNYGASFLFMNYFLDRFGEKITQDLVAEPKNGLDSIDIVLEKAGITDPQTGEQIGADDVFADWVLASYLQDETIGDGRFTYHNNPSVPQPAVTETISNCPSEQITRDVNQYGVDYIQITCPGDYTLNFEGSVQVDLLPIDPHSGNYAFWSNKGDTSDMTLTRYFDFSEHHDPLTLTYWTWYELEKDYDYLYLLASLDGENWNILATPSGTQYDPSGRSYGWAYNGKSASSAPTPDSGAEWIQESLNISQFAGKHVYLRFEYITDAAVYGEGFLLDDVSIPEVGYFTDFEGDDGGWLGEGFVRIHNRLPQTFRLALISNGNTTSVEQYTISGDNLLSLPIHIDGDVPELILVVSGTTRFTRQKAAYRFSIESK
jgi:hypothetical protein